MDPHPHAPVILFDANEPFVPARCATTVFDSTAPSPSFPRIVEPPSGGCAIEYAIWWDWDIGHLYELEHVWVHLDASGSVARAEASWHGAMRPMEPLTVEDGRVVVHSQPGKHAFGADPSWFAGSRARTGRLAECGFLAGSGGVLRKDIFEDAIPPPAPLEDTLARTYLARHAFEPAWSFAKRFDVTSVEIVDWPALRAWIPERVAGVLARLERETERRDYRFLRVGHRGARTHAPDNSIEGIRAAATLGADMVELDVRLDPAGRAVLAHDAVTTGAVALADALDVCRSEGMRVLLEIKDGRAVPAVIDALRERRMGDWVVIASFVAEWLAEYRRRVPRARTCLLFRELVEDPVPLAHDCGATFVLPCWERLEDPTTVFTREWVDRVRAAGLGVMTWHEERPAIIEKVRALGVDAMCSDDPGLLR